MPDSLLPNHRADYWTPERFVSSGELVPIDASDVFVVSRNHTGSRQPVVFLHGIPTWSWIWRNVLPEINPEFSCHAIDLPGFGLSHLDTDMEMSCTNFAELIEQVLDRVLGSNARPVLVTHDFGLLVGAELVSRNPGRYPGLVITNSSLRPEGWIASRGTIDLLTPLRMPGIGQLAMKLARPWMLRAAAAPYLHDPVDPDWFDGFWYPFKFGFGQSLARFFQQRVVLPEDFDRWRSALATYPRKVSVIWGTRDPAFGASEVSDLASLVGTSDVTKIDQASHFLMEDRPRVLARSINRFLQEIE
jgi:pimeloyl-ACP methyl ester carboxylesterase